MRVLIAEDNSALAHVLQFNFQKAGDDAAVAPTGLAAWHALQAQAYDLLITDQQMPELSGTELCQKVRSEPKLSGLPIIFLTAKRLEMEIPRMKRELGVSEVFGKPFSPNAVVRKAHEMLAACAAPAPVEAAPPQPSA